MDGVILNEKTNRYIKIGSRAYNELVKKKVIKNQYKQPNELYVLKESDNPEKILKDINKKLEPQFFASFGKGKNKNTVYKRNRVLNIDILRNQAKNILNVIINKILTENLDITETPSDELDDMIKSLILKEMIEQDKVDSNNNNSNIEFEIKNPI